MNAKIINGKIDAVFFDCDSTLVKIEGLDELAKMAGCFDQIKDMTKQSMDGEIPFEEVLRKKFEMIRPSRRMLARLGQLYIENLVPGAKEVVAELLKAGKAVYIITGEIRECVLPLARELGVPEENILVNDAVFDADGNFLNVVAGPLMKDDGKACIIRKLGLVSKHSAFIGDGYPDCKAKPVVGMFIGFGGVAMRERVRAESDVYIKSNSLMPLLDLLAVRHLSINGEVEKWKI